MCSKCKGILVLAAVFIPVISFTAGAYYKSLTCMKPLVDTALRYHTFKGTIKKDLIPPELELGDYWYNFYFDEPYLLEESSVGRPIYVNSLQIAEPTDGFFNLEDFIGKHVQVSGNFGWGYAESTTIESIAITEL